MTSPGHTDSSKRDAGHAAMTVTRAFEALGVPPEADYPQVKSAYRRLAFEHHPDRNPATVMRFQEVVQAFRVLEAKFRVDAEHAPPDTSPGECAECGTYAPLRKGLDGHRYCRDCLTSAQSRRWLPAPMVVVASCGLAIVSLVVAAACLAVCVASGSTWHGLASLVLACLAVASLAWTCLTATTTGWAPASRKRR